MSEIELWTRNNKKHFWKREKANENVDEMSPYDPFVNSNGKVGARAGTSRWTSDLVLMFLESAEPGEWEKIGN